MDNTKKPGHLNQSLIDILATTAIKVADKHLLNVISKQSIKHESKANCKVLQLPADLDFNEVLTTLNTLVPKDYLKLFIFIINLKKSTKTEAEHEKLKEILLKFGVDRPLVLQLISEDQNLSSISYKVKKSDKFELIDVKQTTDQVTNFPSFLSALMNEKLESAVYETINNLPNLQDSSLILRFFRVLDFGEEFFKIFILKSAAHGSKNDFMATIDAPFDVFERRIGNDTQKYLSSAFNDEQSDEDEDDDAPMTSADDSPHIHLNSVLLTAVEHKNMDVIQYLAKFWSNLLEKLPFDHQVGISTIAFKTGQLDVLCELVDVADFPFPKYFNPDDEQKHERLKKIIDFRAELVASIAENDYEKSEDLIKMNTNLKILYSINNNSALKETINSNKLGLYYYLKTFGLKGDDCNEFIEKLSEKEKHRGIRQAVMQKDKNVTNALKYNQQSVLMLSTKSYIHNKKISKDQEINYRKIIRQWYENIDKVAPEILDVAITCESLKIIYDFESEDVENVALSGSNSAGITYVSEKWIFIGSKISGRNRDLEITQVLAQQICYFVLHLVYNNGGKPYYKEDHYMAEIFDNITKSIDQWSAPNSEKPDDECFGIISSVFTSYSPKDFHSELILRVLYILTEFDNDEKLSKHLKQKYKNLFQFWYDFVVPELKLYLHREIDTIRLNGYIEVLYRIKEQKVELLMPKNFKELLKTKFTIITTNVPTLLLVDIYTHLKKTYGCLLDTKNIFADPEAFKNEKIRDDFQKICRQNADMNVYADCTKGKLGLADIVFANKKNNFVFITVNNTIRDELVTLCLKVCRVNPEVMVLNYNWVDLSAKSQKSLLKYKINFQNNQNLTLLDVLKSPNDLHNVDDPEQVINNYSQVIDDQLLNMLVDGQKIAINSKLEADVNDKKFDFIFKIRKFTRNDKDVDMEQLEIPKITADDVIKITKNKRYAYISDTAGVGKSWAIQNIAKVHREKFPSKWVTYIDIKQYTKPIKELGREEPEFMSFFIEKFLNLKNEFEVNVFKKQYKDGKVCIIFDGFDEIVPKYAEFVVKLMQCFEYNGGNQLWIVIRDFFEDRLMEKFPADDIFKLDEFSRDYGVELIAKTWITNENRDLSAKNFDAYVKNHEKLEKYHKIADEMVKRIETISKKLISDPLFYKMIALGFKDGKSTNINVEDPALIINRFKLLRSIAVTYYKIWSDEKGSVRRYANVRSQEYDLNFFRFHQYAAMVLIFIELIEEVFPYYDTTEWINDEIVECGMLSFKNGKFYFLNVDMRDFFIAEMISKEIKRKRLGNLVLVITVKSMTNSAHKGIQILLNDAFKLDPSILVEHGHRFLEYAAEFCKMDNFEDYFVNDLECLINMIMDILKKASYADVKELLIRTAVKLIKIVKDSKSYYKFEEILISNLNSNDLKKTIKDQEVLLRIVQSELDIEVFENLVTKIESMFDRKFIKKVLSTDSTQLEGNIMNMLCTSANQEQSKATKFLEILKKYFGSSEIIELMVNCNNHQETVLHVCIQKENEDLVKCLWSEIQNSLATKMCKEFAMKKSPKNQNNMLHYAAINTKLEVHQTMWKLLETSFNNREELKDFVLQKDQNGNNFLQLLINSNQSEVVEFTVQFLKENISESQFEEIMMQKDLSGMNLLQIAARGSKELKTHQILWKEFQDLQKSTLKFLELIKDVDQNGNNVLHVAASFANHNVFEFMENELEKIVPKHEIKELLSTMNNSNQNLLQLAARHNKLVEMHQSLWTIYQKYFTIIEIAEFVKHKDAFGNNLESNLTQLDSKEVAELVLSEIQKIESRDGMIED